VLAGSTSELAYRLLLAAEDLGDLGVGYPERLPQYEHCPLQRS
jgi:hypothetical protein